MSYSPLTPEDRDDRARAHAVARFGAPEFALGRPDVALAARFVAFQRSALTALTYASNLLAWFRWCERNGIAPLAARRSDARTYLASLSRRAPRTRAAACTSIRSFYNAAIDDEMVERNPFERVDPKGATAVLPTPALTQAQFEEVLRAIREGKAAGRLIDARDYALLYLAGRLGPRRISLGTLRWGSLTLEAGAAVIAFHVKGDRYDRVLAPPDVLAVLATWHKELAAALGRPLRAEDAVFPPVGGHTRAIGPGSGGALEPMTKDSISYQVCGRFAHVGIVGRGFAAHALRATAATVAYENGATVEEIQAMLGHLNRSQTEAYIRRRVIRSAAARWVPGDGLDLERSA